MSLFGPMKRKDFIARLRALGFSGPFAGAKHEFMERGALKVRLPNPHEGDITPGLPRRILRDSGVSKEEWGEG